MPPSVFLQFDLPSPAAWLYAAFAVAAALFVQFNRLLVLRNLDVFALFLFAPGFLLLEEANRIDGGGAAKRLGYGWLLLASAYWFARCLFDVTTVKRPRVTPNLATAGLIWLGAALLLGLSVDAVQNSAGHSDRLGKRPAALTGVEAGATAVVAQANPHTSAEDIRRGVSVGVAVGCQVAVVVLLFLICARHYNDAACGATAAVLYLLLPVTRGEFDQSHHVWPTALILAAILSYRRPAVAGGLLGGAAGTAFFPVLLLPVWVQFYRDRGSKAFLLWFAVVCLSSLVGTAAMLALAGDVTAGIWQSAQLADWQPWKSPTAEGLWTGVLWAYRLPVFIAFAGFVLMSAVWPAVRDLGQLVAASAAVLIGIQFWYADRGGVYVLWYAPLLLLMVFRPTTTELQPPVPGAAAVGWLGWLRRKSPTRTVPAPGLAV